MAQVHRVRDETLPAGGVGGFLHLRAMVAESAEFLRGVQIIQVAILTPEEHLGVAKLARDGKTYEGFVDRGKNSPWQKYLRKTVIDADKPYYLDADDIRTARVETGEHGNPVKEINMFDRPLSVVRHEEAYFETIVVGVRHKGTGRDRVLKVYRWGWTGRGTRYRPSRTSEANTLEMEEADTPSEDFLEVLNVDYPDYLLEY